jgi:antitoxin component of MazEF toxin-antitoxin module
MKKTLLTIGQDVSIKVSYGKIMIEPITRTEYRLEESVAGTTARNTCEIGFW